MSTVRLVIVLLVLGVGLLLVVQNTSPALPLVFFGMTLPALPLAVWIVLAIALGALTTLVFTALLGAAGGGTGGKRRAAYKYRPQTFYEPSPAAEAAAREPSERATDTQSSEPAGRWNVFNRMGNSADPEASRSRRDTSTAGTAQAGGEWQDWTNLKSPSQWSDWEDLSRAPKPEHQSSPSSGYGSWFGRNRREAEQQRVNESMEELSNDWDSVDQRAYRPTGASSVEDYLDDISQGWEENESPPSRRSSHRPPREFEVQQSPTEVYRDGSMYSYRFRSGESSGQVDNIYAPADDVGHTTAPEAGDSYPEAANYPDYADTAYDAAESSPEAGDSAVGDVDYPYEPSGADERLDEPEVADDGVVDADYRVIIPPYRPLDEPTTENPDWDGDDEWDEADDALTP